MSINLIMIMNKLNENFINKDFVLTRAVEILKVMYSNNSDVTCALSFEYIDGKKAAHWLYDFYDYFEDIDNKIYLKPKYDSNYIWKNGLDRTPSYYFVVPYNYFSMSDDEIKSDYKARKEIAKRKRYEEKNKDNFNKCRTLNSIPIDYIKLWGTENKFDEIINTLINDWNNCARVVE